MFISTPMGKTRNRFSVTIIMANRPLTYKLCELQIKTFITNAIVNV